MANLFRKFPDLLLSLMKAYKCSFFSIYHTCIKPCNQFQKPPIRMGITVKKITINTGDA
jgi:hypothetical protein